MAQETAKSDVLGRSASRRGALTAIWAFLTKHPVTVIGAVALLLRLSLVALSDLFTDFALDDATYHDMATAMAAGDISNWDDFTYSLFWRTAAFLVPITGIYKLFGPTIAYGQIFVALLGVTVAIVVYKLAHQVVSKGWALAAGLMIALLPSQAFWSAQLMKDAAVWLALSSIALSVMIANRATDRRGLIGGGIGAAVGLVALAFLREHTLVVASWAVLIASVAGAREFRVPRIVGGVALCVAIPWFVAAIGPAGFDLVTNAGSLEELRFKMAEGANTAIVDTTERRIGHCQRWHEAIRAGEDPQELARLEAACERARARIAEEGSEGETASGARRVAEEGGLDPNIRHLPRGLSVMLLEPFPVPFEGSAPLRLARLESVLWYPLVVLALVGLWRARRHLNALAFPIVAGAGIIVMYALSEGNIGTAHRHRGEFVWVVALLAVLGAQALSDRRGRTSPPSA